MIHSFVMPDWARFRAQIESITFFNWGKYR